MKNVTKPILKLLAFFILIGIALWLAGAATENEGIKNLVSRYGYIGIFIAAVVSGFNIFVPIPAASFVPLLLESGFGMAGILSVIVAGMTVGDCVGYFIGRAGRNVLSESGVRMSMRLERLKKRFFAAPLIFLFFFASFVPFPNEIIVIPLGFLKYRLAYVLIPLFFGHIVFNLLLSFGFVNLLQIV